MNEFTHEPLWKVDHPYYCSVHNYNSNESPIKYDSWDDFIAEMGDADDDYNFLFRWDWHDSDNEDEELEKDELNLHFMQQRKGKYVGMIVVVEKSDEQKIREYLEKKKRYMMEVWSF